MGYRDNVEALCESGGFQNPIEESALTIQRIEFEGIEGVPFDVLRVEATDMNRAGRLYIQLLLQGNTQLTLVPAHRKRAAEFFTPELWDDCEPGKRTLIYGLKTASMVRVFYK